MRRILFEAYDWVYILKRNKRAIFNFLNQHDLYYFHKSKLVRKALCSNNVHNFIDGFLISLYLSCKHFKKINRIRGPTFTKEFLNNKKMMGNKKHFFIGLEKKDKKILTKKFPYIEDANIYAYNPPYIKHIKFTKREIKKMSRFINKFNTDYVWMCIGSPKQNILSMDLFKLTKAMYFNVGAALDFILGKKKEAPHIVRALGLEWLYRLFTDFKHSKRKVRRSLMAIIFLRYVDIKRK